MLTVVLMAVLTFAPLLLVALTVFCCVLAVKA